MKRKSLSKQTTIQLTGLLLWRFGLLLASATAVYRIAKFLLKFIDLPVQLEIGVGLIFSGAMFFMASILMEQISDGRRATN
jgi:hypothetical protein